VALDRGTGGNARLIDISDGGAMIRGVTASAGGRGRLSIDGLDLPIVVREFDAPDIMHVAFDEAAAGQPKLAALVARLAPAKAA